MSRFRITPSRLFARMLIALVVTGLASSVLPVQPAGAASSVGERAGFSPGGPFLWGTDAELSRDLDSMAATGAKWLRVDFDWPSIESSKGILNWRNTDRVVHAAQARGMRIIALPTYTPSWARPAGTTAKHPPTQPSGFADFVRAAVQRYSPSGVKVWEIWNEPNITGFWQPQPNAIAYTALLQAAATAVRGADPSATVLSGGLSPAVDAADGSQVSPITYLRQVYAAGGKTSFDGVAIHPYSYPAMPMDPSTSGWNTFYRLPLIRDVMVANGDSAKKVWSTEYGAPTSGPGAVSEDVQARMVTEAYNAISNWSWAGPLLWYAYRDQGADPLDREDHFGLVRRDFSPKKAAATFAGMMTAPAATTTTTVAPTTTTVAPTTTTTVAPPPTTVAPAPTVAPEPIPVAPAITPVAPTDTVVAPHPVSPQSYRSVSRDGASITFGDGPATSTPPVPVQPSDPVIGGAGRPGGGTWATTGSGAVHAIGGAPFFGSLANQRLNKPIVGVASTPSGGGYWLVASDGGIFAFGDARFHGSTGAIKLNRAIVGMTATPSGGGYWLVASDGGIFAFGDARFHGSTGGTTLAKPIVGMTVSPAGAGYWLAAADGGIFAFGDARFLGSAAGQGAATVTIVGVR